MAENNFQVRIMQKHDTEANWSLATNFIPKAGELIIYDVDASHSSPRLKIGNGIDTVINLPFTDGGAADIGNATIIKSGLMSAEDKRKLNNIEENATSVYVDSTLKDNSSNAIQNKAVYNALEGKANTEHTHDSGDIEGLSTVATSGSFTDLINRPSIPARVSQLVNDVGYITNADIDRSVNLSDYNNDVGFVTSAVNNLTNYYNKANSYSKTEINNMLNELSAFEIRIVEELPETGESNCFYLIRNEDNENSNYYDEYLWISENFELIGNTKVDLSDYLTKVGNSSNTIVDFEASAERVLPTSGQKLSELFGRIVKFLTDLKSVAFSGDFNDLSNTDNIVLKDELSSVALSGDFNDLSNTENLVTKESLKSVAFSGSFNDLTDTEEVATKSEVNNKQDILSGTEGQVVQFDNEGKPVASTLDLISVNDIDTICGVNN